MDIHDIFKALRSDNSRKGKEAILEQNRDSQILRDIFYHTYNPLICYYIKAIPTYETTSPYISLKTAISKLTKFSNRDVTGNAAIEYLRDILSHLEPQNANIFKCIIDRDLRCGVSESTINKIWKNLVPSYPCLLATADTPKARAKIKFPAFAQEKCDGMRINVIVCIQDGTLEYRSRSGNTVMCGTQEMNKQFLEFSRRIGGDYVFDGELLVYDNGKPLPRKIGNGICNKAIKGTITEGEKELFVICVWDAIPYGDFMKGVCEVPYKERFAAYKEAYTKCTKIALVPTWEILSWNQAKLYYLRLISQGKEGLIIKNLSGVWGDRRSGDLVKMKEELVCELLVTGWVEGSGKYKGKLGALECKSSGKSPVCVSVGSGFSDDERATIGRDIVGTIISVRYNEIIVAENGTRSLFLPRFDSIRHDKTKPDEL